MNSFINKIISDITFYLNLLTSSSSILAIIFLSFNIFHAIASRQENSESKLKIWKYNAYWFYALFLILQMSIYIREHQDDWKRATVYSTVMVLLIGLCIFILARRRERREKEIATQLQAKINHN